MPFVLVIILLVVFFLALCKFLIWFFEPLYNSWKDPTVIKQYTFENPTTKATEIFPNIHSKPTKCLSLIFPAYNEEKRIEKCLDATVKYLQERSQKKESFTWEIIVVNDGSSDLTSSIVNDYSQELGTDLIRLLTYDINQGKGYAVQQGMLHARGCLILFADSDGASEITHLNRLENAIFSCFQTHHNFDEYKSHSLYVNCSTFDCISIGSRAHLQKKAEAERTMFRNLLMFGFHWAVTYIGNVKKVEDTQCGFKMFTRSAVLKTFLYQRIRRWCFDPELLMLAQKQNIAVIEEQIKWEEILVGSKLNTMTAPFSMLRELIIMRVCHELGVWHKDIHLRK